MKFTTFTGIISDIGKIEEKNGQKIIKFQIAINKKSEDTEYFRLIAWNKMSDIVEKYCSKGRKVEIYAIPKSKIINKEYRVWFEVKEIEFLDNKKTTKKEYVNDYDW